MNPYRVTILTKETETARKLVDLLNRKGYICNVIFSEEELNGNKPIDLVLIDINNETREADLAALVRRIKHERQFGVLLLSPADLLPDIENDNNIDDFIVKPYEVSEFLVRVNRLLAKNKKMAVPEEFLRAGDILIDLQRCEVSVGGRIVDLTYTEYELLKLLMSENGRVLSREVLLNKIWGYDYFGGDRTVDVHITRLRSKIEDPAHGIIETVRNIGYRIKPDPK